MNSFNVYGQTEERIGGNTPVWLGTVKPVPVGATIIAAERLEGQVIPAGTPVAYNPVAKTANLDRDAEAAVGRANAYLYNDIYFDESMTDLSITCAIVQYHPEGLLIERVLPEITEEQIAQLQAKIPGVLLVRG